MQILINNKVYNGLLGVMESVSNEQTKHTNFVKADPPS